MSKIKCALIGSGNIGTDLLIKIQETSDILEAALVIGIDADSDGLRIAREQVGEPPMRALRGRWRLIYGRRLQFASMQRRQARIKSITKSVYAMAN